MVILQEVRDIIQSLEMILQKLKGKKLGEQDINNIQVAIEEVNLILYRSETLKFQKKYHLDNLTDYQCYLQEIQEIINVWKTTIKRREGQELEVEFWKLYECFKYVDQESIYQMVLEQLFQLPYEMQLNYTTLPRRYTFLEGKIDIIQGDYSLIRQHVEMMVHKVEEYKWLYERLADNRSKKVLNGIIQYWMDFDIGKLHALSETAFRDYYDLDILKCEENEVMVDLGAYTGDSIIDFVNTYRKYKRIYAYEITPSTYDTLVHNLSSYSDIVTCQKGVGSKSGAMYTTNNGLGAGNKVTEQGDIQIQVVTLDEDIKEPLTIIKMDIEGAEKDAIIGATQHIKIDKPKMLISSYHLPGDIFDIPCMINEIRDDYKYYMRFNGRGIWPCDYVLFAI